MKIDLKTINLQVLKLESLKTDLKTMIIYFNAQIVFTMSFHDFQT